MMRRPGAAGLSPARSSLASLSPIGLSPTITPPWYRGRVGRDKPRALVGGAVTAADIVAARARLAATVAATPCAYSETLSVMTGSRVFVKLENLQITGSFKERGAANLLLQLAPAERRRGVIAASAGNHGLAVAFHAARLGIAAVVVMPERAPLGKVTAARRHGADVILDGE